MACLELLAPAKDAMHGRAAIDSGADAVYIGAPKFGARASAASSLEEIAELCGYAHLFGAKVYVAMNTLLYDNELESVEKLAYKLWEVGADALIVQDMAFAEMSMPPIEMHASTQAAALTPDRALLFEKMGFKRVILERGLSLQEVKDIRAKTSIELEVFVHGAICVCYSGQCYLSQVVANRSGNRGVCAQPCRSTYNLIDVKGNMLVRSKHLLSVADLSLEGHIGELIDAGITSFKIEGRLKDIAYLRNSVSRYNNIINNEIATRDGFKRVAKGRVISDFEPNLCRTFNRGFTPYFLHNTKNRVGSLDTAKATGAPLGVVAELGRNFFTLSEAVNSVPGDGLCFISGGKLLGTNINKTDGPKIYPNKMDGIEKGVVIFRNYDKLFSERLSVSKIIRLIDVDIEVCIEGSIIKVKATDSEGVSVEFDTVENFEEPKDVERACDAIRGQLSKSGGTIFSVKKVNITGRPKFIPASKLNLMRRRILDMLLFKRRDSYGRKFVEPLKAPEPLYSGKASYKLNITNKKSAAFYQKLGYKEQEVGVELRSDYADLELMRTKYCIRNELGICLKEGATKERLYLENNRKLFELQFDCAKCEMVIKEKSE